ncbi:MAG: hypothetical protein EPO20_07475 [Betaproteobacteria bacterium]|nr:MAG: hypothetical protein EPO20_07475 [Betaproteobacteria bacterium]
MIVMAAIVASALYVPVAGLLALLAFVLFGVSLREFVTFGGALGALDGLVAWWVLMLLPALVYAASMMPWAPRE